MNTKGVTEFEECMTCVASLPKRPRVIRWNMIFKEAGDVPCQKKYGVDLWNYQKFIMQLDARMIFKKAEDIPIVEEFGWKLVGATWCSWKQGKMKHGERNKVIDG